jgi:NAD(P)-dependent dehydrogenase (short-subunit alcohol dehydrogenase family)
MLGHLGERRKKRRKMAASVNVAIVTGGARRIGEAIVEDLAGHSWAVAIHCNRSRDDADRLAERILAGGGQAAVVVADLSDTENVGRVIDETVVALGPPTLLVNNAATYDRDSFGSLDHGIWRRQMAINLESPVFLSEAFASAIPPQGEGNIVNIIDQVVWRPTARNVSYQLAKSALWTATQMLAQALAPRIRVNAIAPGPTLPNERQTMERFRLQAGTVLLKRGPELPEFGRTVRFFIENRSITGQMVALDGGQHLWEAPGAAEYDE